MAVEYLEQDYVLIDKPLAWQAQGLRQTASGYGKRLTSREIAKLADGRTRRVYITQYSNAGSAWILLDGKKLFLRHCAR